MVVRFVPVRATPEEARPARSNIAEVIDLRTRLVNASGAGADAGCSGSGSDSDLPIAGGADEVLKPRGDIVRDATRLLARKAQTAHELRASLLKREHDPLEVEDLIDDFIERRYLCDLDLARAVRDKLRQGAGASPAQIRQKLAQRGVASDDIATALAELDADDDEQILRDLAHHRARRLGSLDRQTAERRLHAFLARRGWGGARLSDIVREALDSAQR